MRKLMAPAATIIMMLSSTAASSQDHVARERALNPYRTGWAFMQAEAWPEAARSFQQAIDIDPRFELAHYGLGQALMPQKRFVEATSAYSRCRDLYREQAGRRFSNAQEAQRYRQTRLTELDELVRQLQSLPQSSSTQERLRQLNEQRNQIRETIQRGGNLTIDDTVPAFVYVALGSAFFRSERLLDAEREYKAALRADNKIGEAHNNLAVVYLLTGRLEEAEKEVKAAEKAGVKVHPQLKDDIRSAKRGHSPVSQNAEDAGRKVSVPVSGGSLDLIRVDLRPLESS